MTSLTFQRPDKRRRAERRGGTRLAGGDLVGDPHEGEAEGAEVLTADQVGIRSAQVTGRTWRFNSPDDRP
ncbi:hypothetical protein ABT115_17150 [Streptomyces sp. NPDC001832]|uniref:hypothetical protein n=1 Tax=Streptomyces sp. NPDC001832 TaxID=3154527 RepID=UPI00332465E2